MRNSLLAAVLSAVITGGAVMAVNSGHNVADAQTAETKEFSPRIERAFQLLSGEQGPGWSKAHAECVLQYLDKVRADTAAGLLNLACRTLN